MNGTNFFQMLQVIRILAWRVSIHFSFFALIYTYKGLFHYLFRVIDKIIMPQPLKKRRVTQGESERNLQQLYKEIYEGPFEPGTICFQNEDDDDIDTAASIINQMKKIKKRQMKL